MGYYEYLARDQMLFEMGKLGGTGPAVRRAMGLESWDNTHDVGGCRPMQPVLLRSMDEMLPMLVAEFMSSGWEDPEKCAALIAMRATLWADGHPVIWTTETDDDRMQWPITGSRYETPGTMHMWVTADGLLR